MLDVDWDDPSVGELSRRQNKHPVEVILDLALENDNRMFVQPIVNESPADVLGLLKHPRTLATFSDSGAHVCQEMGSSLQTHLLSYWVRKQAAIHPRRGGADADLRQRLGLGTAGSRPGAHRLCRRPRRVRRSTASSRNCRPSSSDLPGGARRLVQKADGIAATVVNGAVAIENGEPTGDHAGQVLKGPAGGVISAVCANPIRSRGLKLGSRLSPDGG